MRTIFPIRGLGAKMGPNTKILTKRDKESQNRMKNYRVMPINVQAQKWFLAYFGP